MAANEKSPLAHLLKKGGDLDHFDPDEALDVLRDFWEREGDATTEDLLRVTDLMSDLDEWLSAGGALPAAWDWKR